MFSFKIFIDCIPILESHEVSLVSNAMVSSSTHIIFYVSSCKYFPKNIPTNNTSQP